MDPVKEAFLRIKQDMNELKEQVLALNEEMLSIKRTIESSANTTYKEEFQTHQQEYPTHKNNPTDNMTFKALKPMFSSTSIGNEGVPTDRQTDQQTDSYIQFIHRNGEKTDKISHLDRVSEILGSLDSLKKDIRSQFKKLTKQEMLIFSTVYQLQDEGFTVDYSSVASKLKLSESSIRDYVQKIIKKGIPIQKIKENNKKVTLSISQDFKKIASLHTILALREI